MNLKIGSTQKKDEGQPITHKPVGISYPYLQNCTLLWYWTFKDLNLEITLSTQFCGWVYKNFGGAHFFSYHTEISVHELYINVQSKVRKCTNNFFEIPQILPVILIPICADSVWLNRNKTPGRTYARRELTVSVR